MSYRSRLSSSFPLTLTALGALALATGPAGAEEDRLRVTPQVEVSQAFDSDEVVVGDGERSGRIFEVRPGVKVDGKLGGLSFSATAGARSRSNSADSDLNSTDENGGFQLQYQLTPRFTATATASYRNRKNFDPRDSDIDSFENGSAMDAITGRPDRRDALGAVGFQYLLTPRTLIAASVSTFARDYADISGNRDFNLNGAELSLQQSLTPLDRLSLNASYRTIEFDAPDTVGRNQALFEEAASDEGPRLIPVRLSTILGSTEPIDPDPVVFERAENPLDGLERRTAQTDRIGTITAGWQRQLGSMWTMNLTGGVRLLKSRDAGFLGLSGPSFGSGAISTRDTGFDGGLVLTRRSEMAETVLSFRQETRPSSGLGTTVDSQTFRLQHRQRLTRTITLKLAASYQLDESSVSQLISRPPTSQIELVVSGVVPLPFALGVPNGLCFFGESVNVVDRLNGDLACVALASSTVEDRLFAAGISIDWEIRPRLVTFISVNYRDQKRSGANSTQAGAEELIFGRDRDSTRAMIGLRYAYDIDLF